jgi:hypothetical protein
MKTTLNFHRVVFKNHNFWDFISGGLMTCLNLDHLFSKKDWD